MGARRNSTRARRICFDAHKRQDAMGIHLICHHCKGRIDVVRRPNDWRADHIKRFAEGGEDTPENLWPICLNCDGGAGGKAAKDTKEVAKGKRVRDKTFGIKKSKRPMAGSKASPWQKKMSGQVVRRKRSD